MPGGDRLPPLKPAVNSGPRFQVQSGRIASSFLFEGSPRPGETEQRLYSSLQGAVAALEPAMSKIENRFPELAHAYKAYREIAATPLHELDQVSLWTVGSALGGFERAYRDQNAERTLSDPIEPQTAAQLANIVNLHGVLAMRLPETRELVEQADEFLVDIARLKELEEPGNALLDQFANRKDLVERKTRERTTPVHEYVTEFGWGASRTGYAAYLIVRNSVHSLVEFVVGRDAPAASYLATGLAVSVAAGDPNAEFLRSAIPFLTQHSTALLAFFNHSPEFRAYVTWAIALVRQDLNNGPH